MGRRSGVEAEGKEFKGRGQRVYDKELERERSRGRSLKGREVGI